MLLKGASVRRVTRQARSNHTTAGLATPATDIRKQLTASLDCSSVAVREPVTECRMATVGNQARSRRWSFFFEADICPQLSTVSGHSAGDVRFLSGPDG